MFKFNGVDCDIIIMEVMSLCDDGDDIIYLDTCDVNGFCEGSIIDCFVDNGGKLEECIVMVLFNGFECDYMYNEGFCDDGDFYIVDD